MRGHGPREAPPPQLPRGPVPGNAGCVRPSFRIATAADHALVVELLHELVLELGPSESTARLRNKLDDDIRLALASPHVRIFLAEVGGRAIGLGRVDILFADPIFRLREDTRCGYIDQMYVRPGHRDRGIGRALLKLCEQWLREQGLGHVLLHAAPKAVHFYEREGYVPNREMYKRL